MRNAKMFSLLFILSMMVSLGASTTSAQSDPLDMPLVKNPSILSTYEEAQANPRLSEQEKIKSAIDTYFKLKYEGQKQLELMDFSSLVAGTSQSQAWAEEEMIKRQIELYKGINYNLNYLKYEFTLDYQSVQLKDDNWAKVQLEENHEVIFDVSSPEISKLANLEHTITLEKSSGKWVIVSDEYQDELSLLLTHQSKEQIIENINYNAIAYGESAPPAKQDNTTDSISILSTGDWHNLTSSNRNNMITQAFFCKFDQMYPSRQLI